MFGEAQIVCFHGALGIAYRVLSVRNICSANVLPPRYLVIVQVYQADDDRCIQVTRKGLREQGEHSFLYLMRRVKTHVDAGTRMQEDVTRHGMFVQPVNRAILTKRFAVSMAGCRASCEKMEAKIKTSPRNCDQFFLYVYMSWVS